VLPALERHHDVLPPALAGPPIEGEISDAVLVDGVERAMDAAGFKLAHVVGNSLGGYVALQLALRGRTETTAAPHAKGSDVLIEGRSRGIRAEARGRSDGTRCPQAGRVAADSTQ
jgi:pimeloyl-ACP methyl ester carboxylesterase